MYSLQEAFIHAPERCEAHFITDARTLFDYLWLLKRKHLPTAMIILGIAGFFFYISLIGFVILKLYSQRANGLIIIFGWTNRLIQPSYLPFISNSLWSLLSIYEWLFFINQLVFQCSSWPLLLQYNYLILLNTLKKTRLIFKPKRWVETVG